MLGTILATVETSTQAGKMFGLVFWMIMAILGVKKCFSIARRETTSTICVHSLTLTLLSYILMQLMAVIRGVVPDGPSKLVATTLFGIAIGLVSVAGFTLAIVGLSMYRRSFSNNGTRREYHQGRKQAGWAIGLNLIFILLFLGAFVSGLLGRTQFSTAQKAAMQTRKSDYAFDEFNFKLSLPEKNWMELDPKTVSEESCLVLTRRNPEVYVAVIAERPGIELGMTVEQLVEVAHTNLKLMAPTAKFSEVKVSNIGTFEGRRYTVDADVGALKATYLFWVGVRNGYCYQLMFWSSAKNKMQVEQEASKVLKGFRQIDSEKRCYSAGGPYGRQQFDRFGYAVHLKDTDWMAWDDVHYVDFTADSGGVHLDGTRFCVVPMALPVEGATIDIVHKTFLELYGHGEPLNEARLKSITVQDMPGYQYAYSNSENDCIEQMVYTKELAYLVAVWRPVGQLEGLDDAAQDIFDAVTFNPPAFNFQRLEKLPADRRSAQGIMLNRMGLGYFNAGRFPEAVDWFAAGFGCDATNATYFSNILSAHHQMGQQDEALVLLENVSPEIRNTQAVKSWEPVLLYGAGKMEEADAAYGELFVPGFWSEGDFMDWTRLRADNGMWDELDQLFEKYMASNSSVALETHRLELYFAKGDFERVAELARAYLKNQGFSPNVAFWLIDACEELGLYNEGLEVSEQLIEKGYATVNTYQEKAYCEYMLKWYREAKTSLETALKLNPRNETTKEWLSLISAEMGEGDNSLLKEAIEPVELPEALQEKVSRRPVPDFGKEFGAYYNQYLTLWQYDKGDVLKRTSNFEIKVLDGSGVSAFSSLEYGFDPTLEDVFVNNLEVLDAAGAVVARGAIKDYYVLDDDSDGMISEDKKLVIPVPNLQSGYTIKAVVTRRYKGGSDEFYFKRKYFAASIPVLNAAVYLGGDVDAVTARTFNGVEEARIEGAALWYGSLPYTYKWESMQAPVERFVPGVVLGESSKSWKSCGRDYLEEIKEKLGRDTVTTSKARELTAGLKSDEDKYRAIVEWIRSSFTYKPLEFGRDAYIPDTAADTYSFRYGDCKDLSVLLKVMLGAVDVNCELVLANTVEAVLSEIITTDQFNHVIAYLPEIRGGLFVDPTDQAADAFITVPQGLGEHTVLVLDSSESYLVDLPDYDPDSSRCKVSREVSVRPGAAILVRERVVFTGYYASWIRSALKDQQKVKWTEWFQRNVAYFIHGMEVKSVEAENVSEPSKELELEIEYILGHPLPESITEPVELDIQPLWAHHYLGIRSVPNRLSPFRLTYPLQLNIELELKLADGLTADPTAARPDSGSSSFLDWSLGENGTAEYRLKSGSFPAEEFSTFVDVAGRAVKAARLKTVVTKKPATK